MLVDFDAGVRGDDGFNVKIVVKQDLVLRLTKDKLGKTSGQFLSAREYNYLKGLGNIAKYGLVAVQHRG